MNHKIFKTTVRGFETVLKAISKDTYLKVATAVVNELDLTHTVVTPKGDFHIKCLSDTVRIRAREALKREPDTLAWIDTFKPDEVFWDVGSNTGIFTLYAAVIAKVQVTAFDPLPNNYISLTENLALNEITDRVQAFCLAISDKTEVGTLYISEEANTAGGANCGFGSNIDNYGETIDSVREISSLGYTIDDLIGTFNMPVPDHMKVDIDGIQEKVILGARQTMRNPKLKTMMIELQRNNIAVSKAANDIILKEVEDAGFVCYQTVAATQNQTADRETSVTNNFFHRA